MKNIAIKYDKIFEVTSKVVKRRPTVGKLSTLLITKYDDKFPTERWNKFTNYDEVKRSFPLGAVRDFAKNYFNFISKTGEVADELHVMTWDAADKPVALIGGKTPELTELKKLNGKVKFTFGTNSHDIDINLTGKNSHTEIATTIQTAIKTKNNVDGFKDATVTWSTTSHSFIIKAGASVDTILYPSSPDSGTDISNKLGLTEGEGARIINPVKKLKDIEEVLETVARYNDTYYIVTLSYELDDINDLEKIGEWVCSSNFEYLFLYTTTKQEVIKQYNYLEKFHDYTGLMVEYFPSTKPAGFSAGMISSMNLSKSNSNINLSFNDAKKFDEYAISDDIELKNLLANKANSIAKFGRTAEPNVWYYDGTMFGNIISTNVYVGHSYIKFSLQQAFANYFSSASFVGLYNKVTQNQIVSIGQSILQQATISNILPGSVELSEAEKIELTTAFGNKAAAAKQILESLGYFIYLDGIDEVKKCMNIKIAYIANMPAKKLCISAFVFRTN